MTAMGGLLHVRPASMPMLISPTLESAAREARIRYSVVRDLLRSGDLVAGNYEVRAKIGEGGMGQVYEATDRALGRIVAIKISHSNERVSLGNEARALASLRHPGIVAVHAFGEHDGNPYLVMERVAGKSLNARIDELAERGEPFGIADLIDIMIGIADGLAVVHAAGMAHRDVKPSNVLLAPGGRIVLADFGVFQPEIEVEDGLRCGGSAHYLAPEAFAMTVEPGRLYLVDVYALGVVAYELLTGALPYDDPNVMKILWMQGNAPVPDPRAARPDVPPGLAALVRGMLAKDPQDRPRGVDEVLSFLRRMRARLAPPSPCSVLIVEDNAATAILIGSIVTSVDDSARVQVARDASEALEMVRLGAPGLIIVDLHLPGMSGVELCRRLREMGVPKTSTIVATSAHATTSEVEAIRTLGVVQFMPKGEVLAGNLPALVHAALQRATASSQRGRSTTSADRCGQSDPPPAGRPPGAVPRDRHTVHVRRPRVLFVEDDDDTRDLYAWCMRAAGWEVDCIARGLEAVAVAATFQPDVVVMDLHMPVVSGIEAARRLKDDPRTAHIPVVACTAFGRRREAEQRAGGFRFVVPKPCEPEDLRVILESLVDGRDP
jgi:eukaryotic-like serine/threonine-protein kinase